MMVRHPHLRTAGQIIRKPHSLLETGSFDVIRSLSMDSLPPELREQIFNSLLPLPDQGQLIALPSSTKSERNNIYNLRLTSKRTYQETFQAFMNLVQDVPTRCTEKSWENLAALIELPHVCKSMTRLALITSKLHLSREGQGDDCRHSWLREQLPAVLRSIIRKAPRLRSLVCTFEGTLVVGNLLGQETLQVSQTSWRRIHRRNMLLDQFHVSKRLFAHGKG
jgi:hypothetical protein